MDITLDGHQAFVAVTDGEGRDAPPVVFIHGAGMDGRVWDAVAPGLSPSFAVDLPGHGRSGGTSFSDVGGAAAWLVRVLDTLDRGPVCLVGHSYGALIALEAAATAPAMVAGIALLGAALRMPVNADLLAVARETPPDAARMVAGWCHGVSRKADPDGAAAWTRRILGVMDWGESTALAADLAACDGFGGGEAAAGGVACPAHVIVGASDKMAPPDGGRALARALNDAPVTELDCGHMMMMERPDETAAALQRFVRTLP